MEKLFFTVLGMSATGSLVILAVLLARLALRKAPKIFSYALWAVALFRLLCPYTFKSPVSLAPSIQVEAPRDGGEVQVYAGAPSIDQAVYRQVDGYFTGIYERSELARLQEAGTGSAAPARKEAAAPSWSAAAGVLWLAGCTALLGYSALSLIKLRIRLVGCVPLAGERRVRLADHIPSPFVLGLFRPVIYLPSGLPEGERDYILLHERTHIRRRDHVTRALAWLAAAVHWFNPLVWLAFHLAGRDMEMSCDEAVLRKMGREIRADYSTSLLRLSQGGRLPAGPLAFGGGDPQNRIKNILNYKKPSFWVVVLALTGVLYTGTALATDYAPARLIDPDSIVSYTAVNSTSWTITERNTGVSTPEDRQKDLADPAKQCPLSKERGEELVRLVNAYGKSVYGMGGLTLSGIEHHLVRMDRADGGYYLLDYWYWNGFSFSPFHMGEDAYTTLVTEYDAQGNAGTTWQMEYDFDLAYGTWHSGVEIRPEDLIPPVPDDSGIDLSYEIGQTDGVPFVRMTGKVYGQALKRNAVWSPSSMEELYGGHSGGLSMSYEFAGGGAEVMAWWADEEHKTVALSTKMSALLSSYFNSGWWEFTVDLSGEQGAVTEMVSLPSRPAVTGSNNPPRYLPSSITSQEAVFAARIAAKLLTAAEDFYNNYDGVIPVESSNTLQYTPEYSVDQYGEYIITGLGDAMALWIAPGRFDPLDSLCFYQDPAFFCPRLAGRGGEGRAWWTDEDRSAVGVRFVCNGEGEYSSGVTGFEVSFTVDLETGAVTGQEFGSHFTQPVDGETLELTDEEMVCAAQVFAELLRGAETYFQDSQPAPEPSSVGP